MVEGGQGEPVPPAQALPGPKQQADYRPFSIGEAWGPAWGTTWFHLTGEIPIEHRGERLEIIAELGWSQPLRRLPVRGAGLSSRTAAWSRR